MKQLLREKQKVMITFPSVNCVALYNNDAIFVAFSLICLESVGYI